MNRYRDLNTYFREIFGCRVQKITVDAGLTCPNRDGTLSRKGCIYCNARGSGTGAFTKGLSITEQLEKGKNALFKRYKARRFIAYFQSYTNTYAPLEKLRGMFEEALSVDEVVGLSIGTRPDCVNEPILDMLQEFARGHMIWIEYGLQSAHDSTLGLINRGHDFKCFQNAVDMTKERNIFICAHVILGLPGESAEHMNRTAEAIAELGIDGIKLHLLYVVRETALADMYRSGRYHCLSQEQYVERVCDFLERIPPEMVVQRLTGDPHREELIAPRWALNKAENLQTIKETLERRDSFQGKKYFRKETEGTKSQ